MISITTKSPYALQALAELGRARGVGPVPIGELARRRDIPVQFLEQLFATLRRAGVLKSQRGVKGGYTFARPPGEITVLEIVELLEGPLGRDARASSAMRPRPPATCWPRRRSPTWSSARPARRASRCTTSRRDQPLSDGLGRSDEIGPQVLHELLVRQPVAAAQGAGLGGRQPGHRVIGHASVEADQDRRYDVGGCRSLARHDRPPFRLGSSPYESRARRRRRM